MNSITPAGDWQGLISIQDVETYPDLLICFRYLLLKDAQPKLSMEEIASNLHNEYPSFPSTRVSLYNRIEQWRRDGTFRKAEEVYLPAKIEEVRAAVGRAITALPDIIDRLIEDAKDKDKSPKVALDILTKLLDLSQSTMETNVQPGDIEKKFVKATKNFDPMSIVDDQS